MSADAMFQQQPEPVKDEPPKAIPRDRWGRPLIIPPGGGKPKPYLRASTLSGVLDDKTNLGDWKARMTGKGVAISPDLIAGFAAIEDIDSKEGKDTARELAEQAQERAGSTRKRTLGTAFHSFSETVDRGKTPQHVPEALRPLLDDYRLKTRAVRWLAFEQFVVVDELEVAGTADRVGIIQRPGFKPRIWDLKSGRVDYGQMKFGIQLAAYAHGKLYNPTTGDRMPWPEMDLEVGHIIHVDPVTNRAQIYDVDLVKGWEDAKLARTVYDRRKDKTIMKPSTLDLTGQEEPLGPRLQRETRERTTMQRMAACTTMEELTALYNETGHKWGEKERKFANYMADDIRKAQS